MKYTIELTRSAAADLEDIVEWIARSDSSSRALQVLERIEKRIASLAEQPERGTVPMELRGLGVGRYREIFFKPYRVIYQVLGSSVIIHVIADGRRDMATLLQRRLTLLR